VLAVFIVLGLLAASTAGLFMWRVNTWRVMSGDLVCELEARKQCPFPLVYDPAETSGLPAPVRRYFETVLRPGQPLIAAVALEHEGEINLGGERPNWKPFTSLQRVTTCPPGFDWFGPCAVDVRNSFRNCCRGSRRVCWRQGYTLGAGCGGGVPGGSDGNSGYQQGRVDALSGGRGVVSDSAAAFSGGSMGSSRCDVCQGHAGSGWHSGQHAVPVRSVRLNRVGLGKGPANDGKAGCPVYALGRPLDRCHRGERDARAAGRGSCLASSDRSTALLAGTGNPGPLRVFGRLASLDR